jgi:toxin ParE1/3/4
LLKIRLTQTAEQDIEDIWIYTISEWGEDQADNYVALIEKGFSQVLDNPYIGKVRPDVKNGYRALQVKKHLIFYRVGTEFIDVLGIPHIRMDAKRHFESI